MRRLRGVPVLGLVVGFFATLGEVYEAIGWKEPGYHSLRSAAERLEEARKVGALGSPAAPPPTRDEQEQA